jgi:outer membrane protein assembly factor BamD
LTLTRSIAAAALVLFALTACHHAQQKRPVVDPELAKLTKEQAFQKGEDQYAKKKYPKARTYFSYVFENFPNDPLGRRALLRVADSYFAQKDPVNLVEAQYKYRDFINRYPGSDRADYAMLQIAMVSYQQMEKPDRDQQKTFEALEKFDEMLRAYPKSPLRPEAEARRQDVLDRLAKHEHLVARFYMKRKSYNAAVLRLNGIVEKYPNYKDKDAVFFDLGTSLAAMGRKAEARLYFERVLSEFPKSEYAERAKRKLDSLKTA